MNPFDFVNTINSKKRNLIDEDPKLESAYIPYMTNKALSYFPDTILHANEMNCRPGLDKKLQYDFYMNAVRSGNRFSKWKKRDEPDLDIVREYFNCNVARALEYIEIIGKAGIEKIKQELFQGGT